MLSTDFIDPAQPGWGSPIAFVPKQGLHTSLLRRLPKSERTNDNGIVPDTALGLINRVTERRYDILYSGRKNGY